MNKSFKNIYANPQNIPHGLKDYNVWKRSKDSTRALTSHLVHDRIEETFARANYTDAANFERIEMSGKMSLVQVPDHERT